MSEERRPISAAGRCDAIIRLIDEVLQPDAPGLSNRPAGPGGRDLNHRHRILVAHPPAGPVMAR